MHDIVIAVISAFAIIVAPLILGYFTNRLRHRDKLEDWARQDALDAKLAAIHMLVNSNMTTVMQSEYDATVRELAMMKEVIALKRATGAQPSAEALAAVETTTRRVSELFHALMDRLGPPLPKEKKDHDVDG